MVESITCDFATKPFDGKKGNSNLVLISLIDNAIILHLLSPLPIEANPSQEGEQFTRHMKDVYDVICKQIAKSNEIYKQHADARRRHV